RSGHDDDDVDLARDQNVREIRQSLATSLGPTVVKDKILALDVTEFAQSITQSVEPWIGWRARMKNADTRDLRPPLCDRHQWPRCRCATQRTEKFSSPHVDPPWAQELAW